MTIVGQVIKGAGWRVRGGWCGVAGAACDKVVELAISLYEKTMVLT